MNRYAINIILLQLAIAMFFHSINLSFSQTQTDMDNLYKDLLQNYEKSIRPNQDHSQPTNITVVVQLFKILETDMPLGIFSVVLSILSFWQDPRLIWNSSEYGGAEHVVLEKSDIWYPRYIVGLPVDGLMQYGDSSSRIHVNKLGATYLISSDLAKVSCDYIQQKYPFDTQTCVIFISQEGYLMDDIKYKIPVTNIIAESYSVHAEWDLLRTDLKEFSFEGFPGYHTLTCTIVTSRRAKYFMLLNFLPVTLFTVLNTLMFKLPIVSGERIGFSITCLLALAVYLTEITRSLPSGSNNMSYLSYYLTAMIIRFIILLLHDYIEYELVLSGF